MSISRWTVIASVVLVISAFYYFDLHHLLTLENVKRQQVDLELLLL